MFRKLALVFSGACLLFLQSCSMKTETTYYKDSASSMESNILVDRTMFSMMNMMGNSKTESLAVDVNKLSTDWKSLYDIQKEGVVNINENRIAPLKKMFVKVNRSHGEVQGIALKYEKLLPAEIASIFASKKELRKLPLSDFGRWDGNRLEIDTEKFNVAENLSDLEMARDTDLKTVPRTKQDSIIAYGKQMASGMVGMMKMVNMNFSNTLNFQKPIKSITGKHDFVEQIDRNTVRINVRTADLWDEGKLKNKDKKIIIVTE